MFNAEAQTYFTTSSSSLGEPTIVPSEYEVVDVDVDALKQILSIAPYETEVSPKNSTSIINLPMPDGSFESFSFVNSPVMAPELAFHS